MKTGDDFFAVLNLGWESTRRAWRILDPDRADHLNLAEVRSLARDLDQLAYDLRQMQHIRAARLAYSIAFVLNGMGSQSISLDAELAEKTFQIIAVLSDMLLEFEATTEITAAEPAELVEQLQQKWGVEFEPAVSTMATAVEPESPQADKTIPMLQNLRGISAKMLDATQSLLHRIHELHDFPFTPAVTRIHHLAMKIRDDVAAAAPLERDHKLSCEMECVCEEIYAIDLPPIVAGHDRAVERRACEHNPISAPRKTVLEHSLHGPTVLVIDESPFFRMLLSSAIEAAGYTAQTIPTLEEAQSDAGMKAIQMVIWGGSENAQSLNELRAWLGDCGCADAKIVALATSSFETSTGTCEWVRRTDLADLLRAIKATRCLGPATAQKIA